MTARGGERERKKGLIFSSCFVDLGRLRLNFLSGLTGVRHADPGHQWVSLEADMVISEVREAHPQPLTQPVLYNRALSPGLNLLHGGSAWDFNHSLHPRQDMYCIELYYKVFLIFLDRFNNLLLHLRTSAEFHSSKVVHFPVETILKEEMEDVCLQHLQHSQVNLEMSTWSSISCLLRDVS